MRKYREAILYSILIILGFVLAIMKVKPEITNIIGIEKEKTEKTALLTDLERKLDDLKRSELEKLNTSTQVKNIYKPDVSGLGAESSFTVIFDDIIDMAKYNGIKVYSIEYIYNPPEDEFIQGAADKYNVCQLNMQIIADYPDIESFLKELYKYPYLISINRLELTPYPKNKKILMSSLQIKLYSTK